MSYLIEFWQQNAELITNAGLNALLALVVFIGCLVISRSIKKSVTKSQLLAKKVDPSVVPAFANSAAYAVYVVGIIVILDLFGVNTTSLIALLGAAGLAVGLALKDTLSNIAAGLMLMILKPFKADDVIECGSLLGKIKQLGLFVTIMETPDGLFVSVPNSNLWGAPIKNFTRNGTRRLDFVVGIAYEDSIDDGIAVLKTIIENEPRILRDPEPKIMVQSLGDSSVNLLLRVWTTVDDYWNVNSDQTKNIKEQIEAKGLCIPFPQRTLHVVNTNPLTEKAPQ